MNEEKTTYHFFPDRNLPVQHNFSLSCILHFILFELIFVFLSSNVVRKSLNARLHGKGVIFHNCPKFTFRLE